MAESTIGPEFLRYLLLALLTFLFLPLFIYRFRALQRAYYQVEREGLRLRWGLREIDIPTTEILWVHPREDLLTNLPLPPLRWPGSVLGTSVRPLPGASRVEFMASTTRHLLLIGTKEKVYAISPNNAQEFLVTYKRMTELGSLSPIQAYEKQPSVIIADLWRTGSIRYLFIVAVITSLILFTWVILIIPTLPGVRFGAAGNVQELLPAATLLLLPFLNTLFQILDWGLGIYFFRDDTRRPLAYLLWGTSVVVSGLFLLTLNIIINSV